MKYTAEQIAAFASGKTPADLGLTEPTAEELAAQAEQAEATRLAAEQAAQATAKAAEVKPTDPPQPTAMELLASQLKDSQAEVVALNVKLTTALGEVTSLKAAQDGLTAIARQSLSSLHLNVNGSALASTLEGSALVAEHAKLQEAFQKKYPIGGVVATKTAEATAKPELPLHFKQLTKQLTKQGA